MIQGKSGHRNGKERPAAAITRGNGNGHLPVATNGKMLSVSQAAQFLGVHPNSVRRWTDTGLLSGYRIGSRGDRKFKPEDLDSFLLACKAG